MRIAIVSPFNPIEIKDFITDSSNINSINVAASSVHSIVRGLLKLGHEVSVFTSCIGVEYAITEHHGPNAHIYIIPNKHSVYGLRAVSKLRKLIAGHLDEYDVIHAQWTYEYAYAIIPFSKRLPCFCSVRDWCPYLMTIKRPFKTQIRMKVLSYYFNHVMAAGKVVKISNSSYLRRRIIDYLNTDDIPLIPNPIKSELLAKGKKQFLESPVFISIAQSLTDKRKNIETLLKAFIKLKKEYRNAVLKLVGEGSALDFRNIISPENNTDIHFLGKLKHSEVISQIDNSTVLVHPAFEETFGNIFLEASARGIPSIGGYDAGAVPQVLDYGRAGYLCDVHDADSIFETMKLAITDVNYRDFITNNAMRRVNQEYSDIVVCQKHIDLYEKFIENK